VPRLAAAFISMLLSRQASELCFSTRTGSQASSARPRRGKRESAANRVGYHGNPASAAQWATQHRQKNRRSRRASWLQTLHSFLP